MQSFEAKNQVPKSKPTSFIIKISPPGFDDSSIQQSSYFQEGLSEQFSCSPADPTSPQNEAFNFNKQRRLPPSRAKTDQQTFQSKFMSRLESLKMRIKTAYQRYAEQAKLTY